MQRPLDHDPAGRPRARRLRRRCRAVGRASLLVLLTLLLLPPFVAAGTGSTRLRRLIRRSWCRSCCRLLGLEVRYAGEPMTAATTLFVANHVSYLDILLLGARLNATFIAKAEIAGWPLFGTIGRAAGTFFVRRRWSDALVQRNLLASRLRTGESFILFAEGTSSNGLDVLPFKTSLLSVAEPWVLDQPIAVQPVTLAYRRLRRGAAISAENCHHYAWIGDDTLLPHLWALLHADGCVIEVAFGEPEFSWAVTSRKRLAPAMRQAVRHRLLPGEAAASPRAPRRPRLAA